eukprot:GDKJ01030226.1.p1 GENE.GDKJ01030226.1~~GDKJ01030226.1.p1  ORF type:complete len:481 (+),score=70.72 GDKJ01030226.1:66-1508(+)
MKDSPFQLNPMNAVFDFFTLIENFCVNRVVCLSWKNSIENYWIAKFVEFSPQTIQSLSKAPNQLVDKISHMLRYSTKLSFFLSHRIPASTIERILWDLSYPCQTLSSLNLEFSSIPSLQYMSARNGEIKISHSFISRVLNQFSCIESLSLSLGIRFGSFSFIDCASINMSNISLKKLRFLHLRGIRCTQLNSNLENISSLDAPFLEEIILEYRDSGEADEVAPLLLQCAGHLKTLRIRSHDEEAFEISEMIDKVFETLRDDIQCETSSVQIVGGENGLDDEEPSLLRILNEGEDSHLLNENEKNLLLGTVVRKECEIKRAAVSPHFFNLQVLEIPKLTNTVLEVLFVIAPHLKYITTIIPDFVCSKANLSKIFDLGVKIGGGLFIEVENNSWSNFKYVIHEVAESKKSFSGILNDHSIPNDEDFIVLKIKFYDSSWQMGRGWAEMSEQNATYIRKRARGCWTENDDEHLKKRLRSFKNDP